MSDIFVIRGNRLVAAKGRPDGAEDPKVQPVDLQHSRNFYRSLAFLYRSGYSIGQAFTMLAKGMERQSDRLTCLKIHTEVSKGRSLVESFRVAGFPNTLVAALEAGEMSGKVEEALMWYADFEERNESIRQQLKQSLSYPALTLAFALLVTVLLPPFVLKDQLDILVASGAELPFLSKLLFWFSEMVLHPAILLLAFPAYAIYNGWSSLMGTRDGRRKVENFLLKLPYVKDIMHRAAGARSLALMGMLLDAGATPTTALVVSGEGSGSRTLRDRLQRAVKAVIEGGTFAESLVSTNWFLSSSLSMAKAGETTGSPAEMLVLASRIEEEELRSSLERFSAAMQPAVLLFVGVLVCLMVLAVLGPSVSMMNAL